MANYVRCSKAYTEREGGFLRDTGERLDESTDLLQINCGRGLNIALHKAGAREI